MELWTEVVDGVIAFATALIYYLGAAFAPML